MTKAVNYVLLNLLNITTAKPICTRRRAMSASLASHIYIQRRCFISDAFHDEKNITALRSEVHVFFCGFFERLMHNLDKFVQSGTRYPYIMLLAAEGFARLGLKGERRVGRRIRWRITELLGFPGLVGGGQWAPHFGYKCSEPLGRSCPKVAARGHWVISSDLSW